MFVSFIKNLKNKHSIFLVFSVFVLFFVATNYSLAAVSFPLKGFAWTKNFGWVSFSSKNCDTDRNSFVDSGDCSGDNTTKRVIDYGVYVDSSTGILSGYAWSPKFGWLSFEPSHTDICPSLGEPCTPKINLTTGKITGFARAISAPSIDRRNNFTGGGGGTGIQVITTPPRVDTPAENPPPAPYVRITDPTIYSSVTEINSFFVDAVAGVTPGYQGSYMPGNFMEYQWRKGIDQAGCTTGEILSPGFMGRRTSFGLGQENQLWEGKNIIFVRARSISSTGLYSAWSACDYRVVYYLPRIQLNEGPISRRSPVIFVINDVLYAGLGVTSRYVPTGSYLNDFWKYNAQTSTWTRLNNFPGSLRGGQVSFVANGKGYMGLGYQVTTGSFSDALYMKDLWEYDPTSDTWSSKADFPGSARSDASVFVINNVAYVGAGYTKDVAGPTNPYTLKDFYSFDSTSNAWQGIPELPGLPRAYATTFSLNNKGYIGLGSLGTGASIYYTPGISTEIANNLAFNTIPVDAPYGRPSSSVGEFYAFDFWEYNPTSRTWESMGNFPGRVVVAGDAGYGRARADTMFVSLNDKGYVTFGGGNGENEIYSNLYTRTMWEFNPRAILNKWREYNTSYEKLSTTGFVLNGEIFSLFGLNMRAEEVLPNLIQYQF